MSGRGTSGGVSFQGEVGGYIAGLLLAERPLSRLGAGMPGTPKKLLYETNAAVDDILIETDCGEVYIQAKRTINLSSKSEGELASVAEQFVRQYRAGTVEAGIRRTMQPARDRLVLAVGMETAATVSNNLREALDRNRTGAATGIPQHLTSALKTFSELIGEEWNKISGSPINSADKQAILSLCSVIIVGESQRQVVEEALKDVVVSTGDEITLIDLLRAWAVDASGRGVGGDQAAIRLSLRGKVRLSEPPSFKADVSKLLSYSTKALQKLRHFTELTTPDGTISIQRPVIQDIIKATRLGSLAVIGEPGAGKSAILYQIAQKLLEEGIVVMLTVEAGAFSLDALRKEIGLQHSLVEVMIQIASEMPAFLVLDALDAVRGGHAEATYRRLIEDVVYLQGWTVVASIRSFDLRLGKEWRRLFNGNPPVAGCADKHFPNVRHINIALLDENEKAEIASKAPTLAAAIEASGKKMELLARNPFNLALFGDLLKGGVPANSLANVATRGELLERYWEERITELGTPAVVSLRSVVSLMIVARCLDIPETETPLPAAATVDQLQHAGVLVSGQSHRIGFRHHVLFDYAVARLVLQPDRAAALNHLRKETGAGLLISPALAYWLENLKKELSPDQFWVYVVALIGNEGVDPIIRIEVARLVVESVTSDENLAVLARIFGHDDSSSNSGFRHLVGSIISKISSKQPIETRPWAHLLSNLETSKQDQLGFVQALIGEILNVESSPETLRSLGIASRKLFDIISDDDHLLNWLSPRVIPFVARTYGTDPVESRQRLEKIFLPERFNRFGHIEVPRLADEVLSIAEYDADFVIRLYYSVFSGGNFSSGLATSMSRSWILSLTSNAAQDFSLAEYSVTKAFPHLLPKFPRTGIRALASALRGARERKHPSNQEQEPKILVVGTNQVPFEEDGSMFWAWDLQTSQHDNYSKLYRTFLSWIEAVDDETLLQEIPELILKETGISIAWRVLLSAAAKKPQTLGIQLFKIASDPVVLASLNTRKNAIDLLAATYPHLQVEFCQKTEEAWLQLEFLTEQTRNEILGTLFESIGERQLTTEGARTFLNQAKSTGRIFENNNPFEIAESLWDDTHLLLHPGIDVTSEEVAPILQLNNQVKVLKEELKQKNESVRGEEFWQAVEALDTTIQGSESIEAPLEQEVSNTLAEGIGFALRQNYVPEASFAAVINRLLALTQHPCPETTTETENDYERSGIWGSPAPRVEAAKALASLMGRASLWPQIWGRFEGMLLQDSHPAVRLQLVQGIPLVGDVDVEAMWTITEKFVDQEKNSKVIHYGVHTLAILANQDAKRLEPLMLKLANRMGSDRKNTELITFFAIKKDFAHSHATLSAWIQNYQSEEDRLSTALSYMREILTLGFTDSSPDEVAIRKRANQMIWELVAALEPVVRYWPLSGREPTAGEIVSIKLFDSIADQLFYAVGHDQLNRRLVQGAAQRKFLQEYATLISKLSTLGTPRAVYHLLKVLEKLIDADPTLCFDLLSEAMLRTTGVARYEHESMGTALFVNLISFYLADHRDIFTDQTRRGKLIDCLSVFVDAGWPEPRLLFQRLPELLQ